MSFWERTWREREDEVRRRFGPTEPPGFVTAFSWNTIRLPGACALTFPPTEGGIERNLGWHRRGDWLQMSLGLTQPLDEKQVRAERSAGMTRSSFGFELGFVTAQQSAWAVEALYLFLSHILNGVRIKWGDRFAFGLRNTGDSKLDPYTGNPEELGIAPFGDLRAVLFWPFLFPDAPFVTSSGKAEIYIATGITQDEWDAARETTTAQLLLLLCRAGICQRTDPVRQSVFNEKRWKREWRKIVTMGGEEAHRELDAGIGRWSPA